MTFSRSSAASGMRDRIHKLSSFNQPTEQFNLIDDEKTANAWVMPGGRAAVYSGILRYTQNETGLAVAPDTRIEDIQKHIPEALKYFSGSPNN